MRLVSVFKFSKCVARKHLSICKVFVIMVITSVTVELCVTPRLMRTLVQHIVWRQDLDHELSEALPIPLLPRSRSLFLTTWGARRPVCLFEGSFIDRGQGALMGVIIKEFLQSPGKLTHFLHGERGGGLQLLWTEQAGSTSVLTLKTDNTLARCSVQHRNMGREPSFTEIIYAYFA